MESILLRLTHTVGGVDVQSRWLFTPLRNRLAGYQYGRQSTSDGEGGARRRPHNRREIREVKLRAGSLLDDAEWASFLALLDAKKIEWRRTLGGQQQFVEFTLDVTGDVTFEDPENIDRFRGYTLKLVQSKPVWYSDFRNPKMQFTDYN